jgi:transketolase
MPLWGMKCKFRQLDQVSRMSKVITLEDHLVDGGFGSWMLESLPHESGMRNKLDLKGLDPVVCGSVASQVELNKLGGLYFQPSSDK